MVVAATKKKSLEQDEGFDIFRVEKVTMPVKSDFIPFLMQGNFFKYWYQLSFVGLQDTAGGEAIDARYEELYNFKDRYQNYGPIKRFSDLQYKERNNNNSPIVRNFALLKLGGEYLICLCFLLSVPYTIVATITLSVMQQPIVVPIFLLLLVAIAGFIAIAALFSVAIAVECGIFSEPRILSKSNSTGSCTFCTDGTVSLEPDTENSVIADKLKSAIENSERAFYEKTGKKGTLRRLSTDIEHLEVLSAKAFCCSMAFPLLYIILLIAAVVLFAQHVASVNGVLSPADITVCVALVMSSAAAILTVKYLIMLLPYVVKARTEPYKVSEGKFEFYVKEDGAVEQVSENTRADSVLEEHQEQSSTTGDSAHCTTASSSNSPVIDNVAIDLGLGFLPVLAGQRGWECA